MNIAIAIYHYNISNGQYTKSASTIKNADYLIDLDRNTLPKFIKMQLPLNKRHDDNYDGMFHYLKKVKINDETVILTLASTRPIHKQNIIELNHLLNNAHYFYKTKQLTMLEEMAINPISYIGKDLLNENELKNHPQKEMDEKIVKIQNELDQLKVVAMDNVDKVINRGENLDTLEDKSDHLAESSKIFYNTAKKANRCC